MKLKFKDEIIEKQKNELTDVREIASSQNKSLCEKMESYRKVYERLELELMKVNHQFQVLKELTRNKDFSVDVSQLALMDEPFQISPKFMLDKPATEKE